MALVLLFIKLLFPNHVSFKCSCHRLCWASIHSDRMDLLLLHIPMVLSRFGHCVCPPKYFHYLVRDDTALSTSTTLSHCFINELGRTLGQRSLWSKTWFFIAFFFIESIWTLTFRYSHSWLFYTCATARFQVLWASKYFRPINWYLISIRMWSVCCFILGQCHFLL